MMIRFTPQEIEEIVRWHLQLKEGLGDQVGGSGHLGNKSISNLTIQFTEKANGEQYVRFSYSIVIESEFTIYPDNPPHEFVKTGDLILNELVWKKFTADKRSKKDDFDENRFSDNLLGIP